MIGKVLYISLLAMTTITYAQNVGINTKDPKETLDVKGSMRIEDADETKKGVIPLGWLPVKENAGTAYNGEGRVVKKTEDMHTPMAYLTYRIHLRKNGSDWANGVNLKIDADKYTALITQAYLVKTGFNFSNPSEYATYVYAVLKKKDGEITRRMKINHGELVRSDPTVPRLPDDYNTPLVSANENGQFTMGVVQPDTSLKVVEENGKNYYFFYGDYYGVFPLIGEGPYSWVVNILTVEKPKVQ